MTVKLTDLTPKFDGLRNEVNSKIGNLRDDLMTTRSELMAMAHLRDEVFVNFAQAERLGSRSIGASEETRACATQVTATQRVMLNLSARVDEIYLKR